MAGAKIGHEADRKNTGFHCLLKTPKITKVEKFIAIGFSLLQPAAHKEIDSGLSSPNLVRLKIIKRRNKLHFSIPSWPPHTDAV